MKKIFLMAVFLFMYNVSSCKTAEEKTEESSGFKNSKNLFTVSYTYSEGGKILYNAVVKKPLGKYDNYCFMIDIENKTITIVDEYNKEHSVKYIDIAANIKKVYNDIYIYFMEGGRYNSKVKKSEKLKYYLYIYIAKGKSNLSEDDMISKGNGTARIFCYKDDLCGIKGCLQGYKDSEEEYQKNKDIYDEMQGAQ